MQIKDHPILFKGDMVLAIMTCAQCGTVTLEIECPTCGSKKRCKTQTRRVIKPQPISVERCVELTGARYSLFTDKTEINKWRIAGPCGVVLRESGIVTNGMYSWKCPYGVPGDLLWVRETHRFQVYPYQVPAVQYRAGGDPFLSPKHAKWMKKRISAAWCPSIYMSKWTCRLWLKVKSVWGERVQEISWQDCKAEGIVLVGDELVFNSKKQQYPLLRTKFERLWDSINAKPKPCYSKKEITHYESYPWEDIQETREYRGKPWRVYGNPWNFAVEFERTKERP